MIVNMYRNTKIHMGLVILLIVQLLVVIVPAQAEDFDVTPGLTLSTSLTAEGYASPITITATSIGLFDTEATDVKVFNNGSLVNTVTVSNIVVSTANSMSFTLGTGLLVGEYQIRFLTNDGVEDHASYADFVVVKPSISMDTASIPLGYASAVTIRINGTHTNFLQGSTSVAILKDNVATGKAGTVSVTNATTLTVQANTGLVAGSYVVRVTTPGKETVDAVLTVRNSSIALNTSSASVGYNTAVAITVTGTATTFNQGTTSVNILNSSLVSAATAQNLVVGNTTSLSFNIPTGLGAGTYTIRVITGNEIVESTFNVKEASITLSENGVAFSSITAGYASARTITITGTNMGFTSATNVTLDGLTVTSSNTSSTIHSFTLATGVAVGLHTVIATTNGVTASATFNVQTGSIITSQDDKVILQGYKNAIPVTITGTSTSFTGSTTVSIHDSETDVVITGIATGVNYSNAASLSFSIQSGLAPGVYRVCTTTDSNKICAAATFTVTGADATLSTSSLTSNFTGQSISVTGTNTNFVQGSTTATLVTAANGSTTAILTPTVSSHTQLNISASSNGTITPGAYKVIITTETDDLLEIITKNITVAASSITISGSSVLKEGYTSATFNVTGVGTSFDSSLSSVTITDTYDISNPINTLAGSLSATNTTIATVTIPTALVANTGTPKTTRTYTLTIDSASTTFTVIPVTSIAITGAKTTLQTDDTLSLAATATYSGDVGNTGNITSATGIIWASSNVNVATVNGPTVTSHNPGTATITASLNGTVGEYEITVLGPPVTVTMDVTIHLGNLATSLNNLVVSRLNQDAVNRRIEGLTVTLKTDVDDEGVTYTADDNIWLDVSSDSSGALASLSDSNELVASLSIPNVNSNVTILEISGQGIVKWTRSGLNLNNNHALATLNILQGNLIADYNMDESDYNAWLALYVKFRMGTATDEEIMMADLTMDGIVNNLDFSLWLATKKKLQSLG